LQRAPATYVARLSAAEAEARRIADLLTECLDLARAVCAAFEAPTGGWQVEVHFVAPLDATALRALVASVVGRDQADALECTPVAHRDWIAASLEGLPPVRAGRFVVHGAHNRARVPANRIGIEIEAALAFGTGHHATTRGCLLAIDELMKRNKSRRILDLGTGTGVLAIALAKILRTRVLATDIDIRAVHVARANARNNHIAALIETVHAAGFNAPRLSGGTRFDLVLANILLGPLQRLATPIARRLAPGARVVLSGLLAAHANAAIAAYRAQGLALERRIKLDGWVTLVLARPADNVEARRLGDARTMRPTESQAHRPRDPNRRS
jgi:ribosomal protein L11 methyltransferase